RPSRGGGRLSDGPRREPAARADAAAGQHRRAADRGEGRAVARPAGASGPWHVAVRVHHVPRHLVRAGERAARQSLESAARRGETGEEEGAGRRGAGMTQLLVSVRNRAEALAALAGGADLIDVKEPWRGSLGAAPPHVMEEV